MEVRKPTQLKLNQLAILQRYQKWSALKAHASISLLSINTSLVYFLWRIIVRGCSVPPVGKNGKRSTFLRVLPSTSGKYTTIYHKVETPLLKRSPGVSRSTCLSCRFTKIYSGSPDKVYQALLKSWITSTELNAFFVAFLRWQSVPGSSQKLNYVYQGPWLTFFRSFH